MESDLRFEDRVVSAVKLPLPVGRDRIAIQIVVETHLDRSRLDYR